MGDGRANERIDSVLNSQLQARLDAQISLGAEAFQRKANYVPASGQRTGYDVLAPGLYVADANMAAPIMGMGSLADQVGLHGIDRVGAALSPAITVPVGVGPVRPIETPPAPAPNGDTTLTLPPPSTNTDVRIQPQTPAAPEVPPAQSGSQQVAPGFFRGGAQNGGDPNSNGQNGQRPWRAGWNEVAPGFNQVAPGQNGVQSQPEGRSGYNNTAPGAGGNTPGGETTPRFGDKPPSVPTGNGSNLRQNIEQSKADIERSLDGGTNYGWTDFMINSTLGGVSGYAFGGPLSRALDYGTKKYIVNANTRGLNLAAAGDAEAGLASSLSRFSSRSAGLGERAAMWYQQRFGLSGNLEVLDPIFQKDRILETDIKAQGEMLQPEVDRIFQKVRDGAFTAEQQQLLGRYHIFTQKNLPSFLKGAQLLEEDVVLVEKHASLLNEITELQKSQEKYKLADLESAVAKDAALDGKLSKLVDDLKGEGEPALSKWGERITKGITEEELKAMTQAERDQIALARRFKFFSEFQKDATKAPAEFGAVLSGEESVMVTGRQHAKGEILRLEPEIAKQAELPRLNAEWLKAEEQLKQRIQSLEAEATRQGLLQKLDDIKNTPEKFLTPEQKAIVDRAEYLKKGGLGELPAGVKLDGDQGKLVAERTALRNKIATMEPGFGQLMTLKLERERIDTRLAQTVNELNTKLAQMERNAGGATLGTEYTIGRARAEVLKDFLANKGKFTKDPIAGVLTAEDAASIAHRTTIEEQLGRLNTGELKAARGFKAHAANFAKGVLTIEAAQFVDDRLDNLLFGKMQTKPSWYTDSLAVPAAMLVPGGWFKKGATMVGAHVVGKMLDSVIPADPNTSWNRFLRPNNLEAISVAGAFMLPMRQESIKGRLAYMGVAWLGSHTVSYLSAGPNPKSVRDDAMNNMNKDASERTASSMATAIDKFNELGKNHENVLNYYRDDVLSRHHDDLLTGYRNAAILLTAAGETRLPKGTFIPNSGGSGADGKMAQLWSAISSSFTGGKDQQFSYLLPGQDLDLGGGAMGNLQSAKVQLERAKAFTQDLIAQNPDATVSGTKVRQSEIEELNKIEKRVELDLAKIYGRHDISGIYKNLEEFTYKLNQKQVGHLRDQIKAKLDKPGTEDKQYIAKLWRDLALLDLVFAGIKVGYNGVGSGGDGASADIMMRSARAALAKAREYDAQNQDLGQIENIAQDISKSIPGAITRQGQSTIKNPLGISNWHQ